MNDNNSIKLERENQRTVNFDTRVDAWEEFRVERGKESICIRQEREELGIG